MSANRRKSQPNLSKPSEGGSFEAERKPTSKPTNPLKSGLGISAERELGTVGGVKSSVKLTVGVDELIGQQGIDIEIDATNRTVGVGAGIGSTKGKLGVNIGGKVGYDEDGNLSIKGAEAGINIGGFGGEASIDEDEGIRGAISAAGAKIEIGIRPDGKKTVSLCYGVPGGEVCVTFEPDEDFETLIPTMPTSKPGVGNSKDEIIPLLDDRCLYNFLYFSHPGATKYTFDKPLVYVEPHLTLSGGRYLNTGNILTILGLPLGYRSPAYIQWHDEPVTPVRAGYFINASDGWIAVSGNGINSSGILIDSTTFVSFSGGTAGGFKGTGADIKHWINTWVRHSAWDFSIIKIACPGDPPDTPPVPLTPIQNNSPSPSPSPSPLTNKIQLPNYPQHFKRMNCCDKVNEIYRYLGIAKLKRNKFPVSNAFLVPGGSGNDNCFDYYAITQALFRMLANGLILNPKSKPLGSEWQSANATGWASAMYEMMAESMSDGNTTQRFEVAAIMQLTQMMATLAENGRKIEFVVDAIGIEPLLVPEDVPVCFTVYEGHKGFGKKEPKKIDVSKLKTDNDVENVLGKMLKPSLIPITTWKFKPGQISIKEALRNGQIVR